MPSFLFLIMNVLTCGLSNATKNHVGFRLMQLIVSPLCQSVPSVCVSFSFSLCLICLRMVEDVMSVCSLL